MFVAVSTVDAQIQPIKSQLAMVDPGATAQQHPRATPPAQQQGPPAAPKQEEPVQPMQSQREGASQSLPSPQAQEPLEAKYMQSLAEANTTLQVALPSPRASKQASSPEPLQPHQINHNANGTSHAKPFTVEHQLSSPPPLPGALKHSSLPHTSHHSSLGGQNSDVEKLQLRLQKAERALEHERAHTDMLRQQLAAQQSAAQVGEHASVTIQGLEADLAKARALAEQRTSEGEALRRSLLLSDETVARLRQQLAGVLESNQLALAREQQMEQQVTELRQQLADQAEQHAEQLSAAQAGSQHATEQAAHSSAALREEVGRLKQQNHKLLARISEQEAALNAARAECARKEAGIRALESVLSRAPPQPHTLDPPGLPATVTIDILAVDGGADTSATATCEILTGGLTDNQWKLVMLSEEVRCLRASVGQLRQQQEAQGAAAEGAQQQSNAWQAAGVGDGGGGRSRSVVSGEAGRRGGDVTGTTATGSGISNGTNNNSHHEEDDMKEVVEVDLPPEEIKALIARLADEMLSLEEELQQLTCPAKGDGSEQAVGKEEQGNGHAGQAAAVHHRHVHEAQGLVHVVEQSELHMYEYSGVGRHRRGRRRGWWGWLLGGPSDDSLV